MVKFIIYIVCFCFYIKASAQGNTAYFENFEGSTYNVTNSGTPGWSVDNTYSASSSHCYRGQMGQLSTSVLELNSSINITGYDYLLLEFKHICHIDFSDRATISFSLDNGNTWIQFNDIASQNIGLGPGERNVYLIGDAIFSANGNAFSIGSHATDWLYAGSSVPVVSGVWFKERFVMPLSQLMNGNTTSTNIRIRFELEDQYNAMNGFYGWLIDDISVKLSDCYPVFPSLTVPYEQEPICAGTVYSNLGPYNQSFSLSSPNTFSSVQLKYFINGNNSSINILSASVPSGSPSDKWIATIPAISNGDEVSWWIEATDNCNVTSRYPESNEVVFKGLNSLTFPLCDQFNQVNTFFNPTNTQGTDQWKLTTNAYDGETFISQPYAWSIGNFSSWGQDFPYSRYEGGIETILSSVDYQLTGNNIETVGFWISYKTEQGWDGVRCEYSTDAGSTWETLGEGPSDANGTNWYSDEKLMSSGKAGWSGQSNGMIHVTYDLTSVSSLSSASTVRFRLVFNSDRCINKGSIIVDDFCLD